MAKDLVFEIGTEEIPAGFVPRALASLEESFRKNLEASRLAYGGVRAMGTPRRLALLVEKIADKQEDSVSEVRGPQKKAAYDPAGKPTNALLGFCKAQGLDPGDLKVVTTDKGEYVYAVKKIKGENASKILPSILEKAVTHEHFPKTMRWNTHDVSFARPVHWILAVYGGKKLPLSFGHLNSSNLTYGHRFLSGNGKRPAPIKVSDPASYMNGLKAAFVIPDPDRRKEIILKGLEAEAKKTGGRLIPDEGLLEEVAYLVEYPVVVRGSFSADFLTLPRDIIINAMREHQRYFSIEKATGELLPYFLTIANTKAKDMGVVRKGNERVLRARLNDAKFYFDQDVKKRLPARAEALRGVVFQAKLGTSYEKAERFTSLALWLGGAVGFSEKPAGESPSEYLSDNLNPASFNPKDTDPGFYSRLVLGRAAMLSKADLVSGVVGEFPKLQGIMGGIYAKMGSEVDAVCTAIYEHYMPTTSGGALPASIPGALVSIADKLDTIAGCFSVGLIPTGAQDPYALRRGSLGIIAIILDKELRFGLDAALDEALKALGPKMTGKKEAVRAAVLEFFKERLKNSLLAQGLSFDSIDAVLSAPWFDIVDAVKRIKAIEAFKKNPACPSLVTSFKRVSNILKGMDLSGKKPDAALFQVEEEKALFEAASRIAPLIEKHWKEGDYEKVFATLASIKEAVDEFFDKVMVMVDDPKIRENRLILLNYTRGLYFRIADLSRLMV